jgi:hypothetical protein
LGFRFVGGCDLFLSVGGNHAAGEQRKTTTMKSTKIEINGVRFLKHGVKDSAGKYYPAHVCRSSSRDGREYITIYAKSYCDGLPVELKPENDSDMMTDYFEKDRATFFAGSSEFNILAAIAR